MTKNMLLLIISLCLHYDMLNCVNYEKINFNEDLLMKQHLQNSLQIKAFIKEARHRFHEEVPVLGENHEHETTRHEESLDYKNTHWWWDNSTFMDQLGMNPSQSFLLPSIRSRPSFPFSITPYTTELNDRHLNWNEIFPDHNTSLRSGSEVSSIQLNRSLPQSPSISSLKDQISSSSAFQSLRYHSTQGLGLTTTSITLIEEYMKLWLQEITTFTPVERWMQTLTSKIRETPSYTTNRSTQTSVENRQLKNDSKDQPLRILHQDLPLSDKPPTTTTAPFIIVNVGGILHLRTATMKEETATMSNAPRRSSKNSRRFHSKARKRKRYHPSHKRKRRRHRQKHRYRYSKYSGDDIKQKQEVEYPMLRRMRKTTESWRRYSFNTQSLTGKKRPKLRGFSANEVTRPSENVKHSELIYQTTPMSQSPAGLDDTEDDELKKFIEVQDKLRHRRTAQKDKTFIYHQVKESLKDAEKKQKEIRLKDKLELIRKIVEGSSYSYSDEEATLRKKLIGALQYGNST